MVHVLAKGQPPKPPDELLPAQAAMPPQAPVQGVWGLKEMWKLDEIGV